MLKALQEIESIIAVLKVRVNELENDNKSLKRKIAKTQEDLRKFLDSNQH